MPQQWINILIYILQKSLKKNLITQSEMLRISMCKRTSFTLCRMAHHWPHVTVNRH